jgi:uncharacterized protein YjbJ (UPF0337 family)
LIHAAFFAHTLTPISVYVIDPNTQLQLASGQIGNVEEVFHGDGLAYTILIAVLSSLRWLGSGLVERPSCSLVRDSQRRVGPNPSTWTRATYCRDWIRNCINRSNRMSGKSDKIKGRVKEAAGALTNDRRLKNAGKVDQASGAIKDGIEKLVDKVKGVGSRK